MRTEMTKRKILWPLLFCFGHMSPAFAMGATDGNGVAVQQRASIPVIGFKRKTSIIYSIFLFLSFCLIAGSASAFAQAAPEAFDVDQPQLRVFLPSAEVATGRSVVICPGGGYEHLAFDHEGCGWAPYFNNQGIAVIVLKYRMPHGDSSLPIADAQAALKTVCDSADAWRLNPNDVGIMGFSAGGHLASYMATHANPEYRPAFQILFYPVITMDKAYTHLGSHDNLLGNDATPEKEKAYSNEKQVSDETPRAFIVHCDDDDVVPPANSVNYYLALNRHYVPSSLHIYPAGGHGWGIRDSFPYKEELLHELTAWLNSFTAPRKDAIRVACMGNSITYGSQIKDRVHDSYPAVLGRMLGNGYQVKNFGMSGCTLLSKGDRPYRKGRMWAEAVAYNPDIIILKLGTNDSKSFNWKHKKDFKKDLQDMLDTLKSLPSHPDIYLCYPSKAYQVGSHINDSIIAGEITPMIRQVAKKNKLPVIDLHSAMDGKPQLFPDNVHPNEEGARLMAKTVYESLQKH